MRIWTTVASVVLLVVEALFFAVVGWVLGLAVQDQNMSLGGLSPDAMADGAWVGMGLLAAFLVVVAAVLARTARSGGAMGRPTRILLIVCAVLHGVLAAVLLALNGVVAFVAMLVMVALLVLVLLLPPAGPVDAPPKGVATA
ncbi:hypothetical protein [Streptacidiphilus carbonis]|jgi:hypothetical protein|uniref:hypothetical protein n=1 Tax=Streptacidiphilus carbonis TaxID=105422 RepID=UPI0005A61AA6|nr:hypothetical protein [Streptacidiphilus carbonis]